MHPIAGQGLNVGLRDVAALVEVLAEGARLGLEPGDAQLLARYERWRAADTFMVAAATDVLTRLFGCAAACPAWSAASAWPVCSACPRSSAGSWTKRGA
jgi:2-octaprenyl-6-methoxyphenol hydroxylase